MKYVLVTGGVVSGLGKGVTASSIGVVLKACGLRVTSIKIGICLVFLLKILSFDDFSARFWKKLDSFFPLRVGWGYSLAFIKIGFFFDTYQDWLLLGFLFEIYVLNDPFASF